MVIIGHCCHIKARKSSSSPRCHLCWSPSSVQRGTGKPQEWELLDHGRSPGQGSDDDDDGEDYGMVRWPGWQRRQTCDGRKWNWISGCSTPARLRMNPPAFTLDVVIEYLFKSVKRDSRSKFLFKSGDVFSYQRSKNQPTNKQELALRICENTCTQDLSSSDFGFKKMKITSRCAVAAAPVLFRNHSTPTWGKHLRVA